MREAMRVVASVLKQTQLPFALGGGYGLWAWGGPEPEHDVDFLVAEADVESIVAALSKSGLQPERPPEDWLVKVHVEGALVDLLHRVVGEAVTADGLLQSVEDLDLLGIRVPVLQPTELISLKLASLTEHNCDFAAVLPAVRAVRERVDWPRVLSRIAGNPFAEAFIFLLKRLDIVPAVD
ncbi:MAG: hypothetical protein QOK10_3252 [Pseudonocardiales bacterium]|nr:hypothetical protein [Pseudonocardiales bacterium]